MKKKHFFTIRTKIRRESTKSGGMKIGREKQKREVIRREQDVVLFRRKLSELSLEK